MYEIGQKELKNIELEILQYVDSVCTENGLRYYLAYGTLIGAVRHKGFIPWDDDIDIFMPIEDYLKFIKIPTIKKYKIMTWENTDGYFYPFAKVLDKDTTLIEKEDYPIDDLGVYIDVFPLIGIDENIVSRALKKLYVKFMMTEWRYSAIKRASQQSSIIKRMLRFFPYKIARRKGAGYWLKRIYKFQARNITEGKRIIGDISGSSSRNFIGMNEKKLFEGKLYPVPKYYHELLKSYYGDYMVLPPKEKQISNHNFIAYKK